MAALSTTNRRTGNRADRDRLDNEVVTRKEDAEAVERALRQQVSEGMYAALRDSGMSQPLVAELMPVQLSQLSRYLRCERTVPLPFIIRFAEVIGSNLETILRTAELLPKIDVSSVIDGDPDITEQWKFILKTTYETAVRDSADRRHGVDRGLRST